MAEANGRWSRMQPSARGELAHNRVSPQTSLDFQIKACWSFRDCDSCFIVPQIQLCTEAENHVVCSERRGQLRIWAAPSSLVRSISSSEGHTCGWRAGLAVHVSSIGHAQVLLAEGGGDRQKLSGERPLLTGWLVYPQTRWLTAVSRPTALEARGLKPRCEQGHAPSEAGRGILPCLLQLWRLLVRHGVQPLRSDLRCSSL